MLCKKQGPSDSWGIKWFLLKPISMAETKCRVRNADQVSSQSPHKPTARKWTFQEKYWLFFFCKILWRVLSPSMPNKGEFPEEHSREVTNGGRIYSQGKIPVPPGKPLPLDSFDESWTQLKAFLQGKFFSLRFLPTSLTSPHSVFQEDLEWFIAPTSTGFSPARQYYLYSPFKMKTKNTDDKRGLAGSSYIIIRVYY